MTFLQNTGKMMEQVCEVDSRQRANRFEDCEAAESAQSHFSEGPSCLVLDAFVLYALAGSQQATLSCSLLPCASHMDKLLRITEDEDE